MAQAAPTTTTNKRRIRRRWIILIVLVVLIGSAAAGVYAMRRSLESPAVGKVVTTLPAATRQQEVELAQYDGASFSFVHPMTYIEQTTKSQPQANELESHTFISSGMVGKVLVIAVTKLPSGKLDDDSSYYMRTQNSGRYKMKAMVVKNETVVTFTDSGGQQFQQVAFWAHGGKLLSFALTGGSNDPDTTVEFSDMVNSISWR